MRIPSGDPAKEVSFRLEAVLKNMSVGYAGGVTSLPYETWLFPERASIEAVVVKDHLLENEVARNTFNTVARRNANTMLCQFRGMVEDRKEKNYLDLDPFFQLEVLSCGTRRRMLAACLCGSSSSLACRAKSAFAPSISPCGLC